MLQKTRDAFPVHCDYHSPGSRFYDALLAIASRRHAIVSVCPSGDVSSAILFYFASVT